MEGPRRWRARSIKIALLIPVFITLLLVTCFISSGYSSYGSYIEGDLKGDCDVCHPPGDFAGLNPYGVDFEAETDHVSDAAGAISAIGHLDSDDDGYPNRNEIENASNPGDATSIPSPRIAHLIITNVNRSAKDTYEGQKMFVYAYVNNTGNGNARDVNVSLIIDGEVLQTLKSITILKEEMRYVIFEVAPVAGTHKAIIEAEYSEGTATGSTFIFVDEPPKDLLEDLGIYDLEEDVYEEHDKLLPAPGFLTILALISMVAIAIRFTSRSGGK